MTRITAFEIQSNGNNIKCSAHGPSNRNGKYAGLISLWRNRKLHKEMLSTESVFDTAKEAMKYMEGTVKAVRAMDLGYSLDKLDN